jgi:hypothetical protein
MKTKGVLFFVWEIVLVATLAAVLAGTQVQERPEDNGLSN